MTARDDIEAVAGGVLAGHRIVFQSDGDYGELQWIECTCDYEQRDNWTGDTEADHDAHVATVLAEALEANTVERLTHVLGCHPGTRENDGTPCASGLHSPALWGDNGCTWVAEVAECLEELT